MASAHVGDAQDQRHRRAERDCQKRGEEGGLHRRLRGTKGRPAGEGRERLSGIEGPPWRQSHQEKPQGRQDFESEHDQRDESQEAEASPLKE